MPEERPIEFRPEHYHTTFGPHEPALTIQPGDEVVTWCRDARGFDEDGEPLDLTRLAGPEGARQRAGNPQTGPFAIEGAEPGDSIAVHLLDVRPTRDWAWSTTPGTFGFFSIEEGTGPLNFAEPRWTDPDRQSFRWELDLERGIARLPLERSRIDAIEIALHPFLGCLGVAPEHGETIRSLTPGHHGGNMDCPQVRAGATIHLPVYLPGALLLMGDCHAAQGDGELCGSALETSCRVRFRVDLHRGREIRWPRVEDDEHIMAIGSARPLRDAFAAAHVELLRWLVDDYGFDRLEAYQALSQVGTARVGNVVDPAYSVVARFPKSLLP